MERNLSIVEYFYDESDDIRGDRCGYCKSSDGSISQGMWGHQVTCQDYQDLIDRGWRRSGKYLYKPNVKKTCCPLYTIRCDATKFQPSKSHKKLLKKVMKFLNDKPTDEAPVTASTQEDHETKNVPDCSDCTKDVKEEPRIQAEAKSVGADPDKPKCRKAKVARMERKHQKLAARGIEVPQQPKQHKKPEGKTLEELIVAHLPSDQSTHRLERVLLKCDPELPEFKKTYLQSFELFCKYQKEIHKDKPEKLDEKRIKLVKVDMDNEDFVKTIKESHGIFAKYQMNVHGDKPDECGFQQFKRFLVDSPLVFEKHSSTPTTGWGSFHEQFFLDGKLIAVGVLDILPHCISSVYLYYDTDYSFLSPGVYSALRELHLTRELNKSSADLKYYYMGFYIHSCPKMKYKGQYSPSYLACPETYSWIPIEKCVPKLDVEKYSRLDDTDKEDAVVDCNTVLTFVGRGGPMNYRTYKSRFKLKNDEKEVKEYAQLVGPLVAPRMALYRH